MEAPLQEKQIVSFVLVSPPSIPVPTVDAPVADEARVDVLAAPVHRQCPDSLHPRIEERSYEHTTWPVDLILEKNKELIWPDEPDCSYTRLRSADCNRDYQNRTDLGKDYVHNVIHNKWVGEPISMRERSVNEVALSLGMPEHDGPRKKQLFYEMPNGHNRMNWLRRFKADEFSVRLDIDNQEYLYSQLSQNYKDLFGQFEHPVFIQKNLTDEEALQCFLDVNKVCPMLEYDMIKGEKCFAEFFRQCKEASDQLRNLFQRRNLKAGLQDPVQFTQFSIMLLALCSGHENEVYSFPKPEKKTQKKKDDKQLPLYDKQGNAEYRRYKKVFKHLQANPPSDADVTKSLLVFQWLYRALDCKNKGNILSLPIIKREIYQFLYFAVHHHADVDATIFGKIWDYWVVAPYRLHRSMRDVVIKKGERRYWCFTISKPSNGIKTREAAIQTSEVMMKMMNDPKVLAVLQNLEEEVEIESEVIVPLAPGPSKPRVASVTQKAAQPVAEKIPSASVSAVLVQPRVPSVIQKSAQPDVPRPRIQASSHLASSVKKKARRETQVTPVARSPPKTSKSRRVRSPAKKRRARSPRRAEKRSETRSNRRKPANRDSDSESSESSPDRRGRSHKSKRKPCSRHRRDSSSESEESSPKRPRHSHR